FFFQAEDGIRDATVTGVQTCALPISGWQARIVALAIRRPAPAGGNRPGQPDVYGSAVVALDGTARDPALACASGLRDRPHGGPGRDPGRDNRGFGLVRGSLRGCLLGASTTRDGVCRSPVPTRRRALPGRGGLLGFLFERLGLSGRGNDSSMFLIVRSSFVPPSGRHGRGFRSP